MKPRKAAPKRFALTGVERVLLELYRTVPQETRALVGQILFNKWTHATDKDERDEMAARRQVARRVFNTGVLYVSVFDQLTAGGVVRVEDKDYAQ